MRERLADRIMEGLKEATAWSRGKGRVWVTFPDGVRRHVTRSEYKRLMAVVTPRPATAPEPGDSNE